MKRIEGSFVPSLNNVNLCNTTQIVLFRFFKDSQQSIQFKYFNTVKNKTNKQKKNQNSEDNRSPYSTSI